MKTSPKNVQEENLDILVRNGGFQFTDTFFPYTSGEIGPYYIQSGVVMANGHDYQRACAAMKNLIDPLRKKFDVITGGETRDWMFSPIMAECFEKPHAMLYKSGKVVGANLQGNRVLQVADLNNEGSSLRDYWVPIIHDKGGDIENVVFYVDRMEDGTQVVEELGLNSHVVVPLNEYAWDCLQQIEFITPEIYRSLRQRMEDKDTWAIRMLRSGPGIETLIQLFQDPKTTARAQKILSHGYPKMAGELKNRLLAEGLNQNLLPD